MNQISKDALKFLEEARQAFQENENWATYRDDNEEFIALRTGLFEDCITIYELGSPVGNFTRQLNKRHKAQVDYEDYEKLERYDLLSKTISNLIEEVKELEQTDANEAVINTLEYLRSMFK